VREASAEAILAPTEASSRTLDAVRTRVLCVVIAIGCGGEEGDRATTAATFATTLGGSSTSEDGTSTQEPTSSEADSAGSENGMSSQGSEEVTGPPPDETSCRYGCSVAADCLVSGTSYGHTCQSGKCVIPCMMSDGCVGYFSGWLIEPCTQSADCEFNTCVTYGDGSSGCAFIPELGSCADLGLQDVERTTTEGETVTVCAEPNATCVDLGAGMECIIPCTDFVECYADEVGELCTEQGECVYACAGAGDCPASRFDNVAASCQ
jgi:hypothetical protein